jgi:hypothetical protein
MRKFLDMKDISSSSLRDPKKVPLRTVESFLASGLVPQNRNFLVN